MPKVLKVINTIWGYVDGVLCAICIARDSVRREVQMAIPAAAFLSLAGEARRRIAAEQARGQHVPIPEPWMSVRFLATQTMNVGTTDNQKVGVILDRGLETEFGLSIEPEYALELGRQLIAEAEKIRSATPKLN
jgi:hypothetical protein